MRRVKPYLKESAIITDVGSTKSNIMQIAAGGFKDITRIANSSPVMWQ